jgi:hypothetical protein
LRSGFFLAVELGCIVASSYNMSIVGAVLAPPPLAKLG